MLSTVPGYFVPKKPGLRPKKPEDPTTKAVRATVVDDFSTVAGSRYRYAVSMHAGTEKGSLIFQTSKIQVLLNFCRTVVRSDDELLQHAIVEYREFLAAQQRT